MKRLENYLSNMKISVRTSYVYIIIILILFLTFSFLFLSQIIEINIIILFFFLIFLASYSLVIIKFLCEKSESKFIKNNRLFFQIVIIILLSIAFGSSFARIFYPPTLPYTIIFGPLSYSPYDNSTQKGISPSLILKCEQREFKNIIEEQIITCIIKKNIPGWNNTVINHIEVNYGSDSNNFWKNLDKGDKIDFNIKNENNYTITAFYHGGNIKVDLFNKIDFLSIDDYSELRYKRMGIISAFVIFSMSILISFVKNISEMKRDNSILPEPNRNNS